MLTGKLLESNSVPFGRSGTVHPSACWALASATNHPCPSARLRKATEQCSRPMRAQWLVAGSRSSDRGEGLAWRTGGKVHRAEKTFGEMGTLCAVKRRLSSVSAIPTRQLSLRPEKKKVPGTASQILHIYESVL